jgi:hypothetical protein
VKKKQERAKEIKTDEVLRVKTQKTEAKPKKMEGLVTKRRGEGN